MHQRRHKTLLARPLANVFPSNISGLAVPNTSIGRKLARGESARDIAVAPEKGADEQDHRSGKEGSGLKNCGKFVGCLTILGRILGRLEEFQICFRYHGTFRGIRWGRLAWLWPW